MKELEAIKGRAEAATEGPWIKDPDEPVHVMKPDKPGFSWDGTVVATLQRDDFGLFEEANADFIAHSRTDIPKLIAALEAVEKLAKEWQKTPKKPTTFDAALHHASMKIQTALMEIGR